MNHIQQAHAAAARVKAAAEQVVKHGLPPAERAKPAGPTPPASPTTEADTLVEFNTWWETFDPFHVSKDWVKEVAKTAWFVQAAALAAARARTAELERAIVKHHAQKADDRCIEDDDQLYAVVGLPPCDRRVGDKAAMLKNCQRFIERRCEGGGWPSYVELEAQLAAKDAEIERLTIACAEQNHEIEQTLGKALGYPWFKDDPKNFPDATEENGVCVGDHVAESLASEAADKLAAQAEQIAGLCNACLDAQRVLSLIHGEVVINRDPGIQECYDALEAALAAAPAPEPDAIYRCSSCRSVWKRSELKTTGICPARSCGSAVVLVDAPEPDAKDRRIAELEAALKPFAESGRKYASDVADESLISNWWPEDNEMLTPTVGDLRRAAKTLNRPTGQE